MLVKKTPNRTAVRSSTGTISCPLALSTRAHLACERRVCGGVAGLAVRDSGYGCGRVREWLFVL